jgi:sugar phosphate isomerase/epimerase
MNNKIHAHVPYPFLDERLELILKARINVEIFLGAEALDEIVWEKLGTQADALHSAGLFTTIHAPFLDLNPGAIDVTIRDATRKRFIQVFHVAELLRPKVIVFHPGFDELRYGDNRLAWLKNSIAFWEEFIPLAKKQNCIIAVENIFEKEPSTLLGLLEAINDPFFRHCFDVGHWNMFTSVSMEEWFEALGPFIAEVHLHDNHGRADEHLPIGEGVIDFKKLFFLLERFAPDSVKTLEAHSVERMMRALENIGKYL